MDFGDVMKCLRAGLCCRRDAWSKGDYIFLPVPLSAIDTDNFNHTDCIQYWFANPKSSTPYSGTFADLVALDWGTYDPVRAKSLEGAA